jgi:hypothetical protein
MRLRYSLASALYPGSAVPYFSGFSMERMKPSLSSFGTKFQSFINLPAELSSARSFCVRLLALLFSYQASWYHGQGPLPSNMAGWNARATPFAHLSSPTQQKALLLVRRLFYGRACCRCRTYGFGYRFFGCKPLCRFLYAVPACILSSTVFLEVLVAHYINRAPGLSQLITLSELLQFLWRHSFERLLTTIAFLFGVEDSV